MNEPLLGLYITLAGIAVMGYVVYRSSRASTSAFDASDEGANETARDTRTDELADRMSEPR